MMEMVANMQKYMILLDLDNAQKAAELIKAEGNERWTRIVNNHLSMTRSAFLPTCLVDSEGESAKGHIINYLLLVWELCILLGRTVEAGGLIGKNIFKAIDMDAKQLNSALKYQMGSTFFDDSKKLIVVGSHALHSPRSRSGIPDFYKWQKGLNLPDVHFALLTPEHGNHDLGREADQYSGRPLIFESNPFPFFFSIWHL